MRAPTYLWKRGSSFFFQFAIPADLVPILGRTPFRSRLPVDDPRSALRIARVLSFRVENLLMSALSKLPKDGRSPLPDRSQIAAMIEKDIAELHTVLLRVETGPDAPDRRTKNGQIEFQERRADALAAALRAMQARALGIADDWHQDIREANDRLGAMWERNEDLEMTLADIGGDLVNLSTNLKTSQANVLQSDALKSLMERLEKSNKLLAKESRKMTDKLEYRGPPFSECLCKFEQHIAMSGVSAKEQKNLRRRAEIFIDLIGDKEIGRYNINDLQKFATELTHLPERHGVVPQWKGWKVSEIISDVKQGSRAPGRGYLTESTIATGYVGRVKQILRYLCATYETPFPFEAYSRVKINAQSHSVVRHGLDSDTVNTLLRESASGKTPEVVFGPVLALLTGARIGEIVGLQTSDLRFSDGVWVLDLTMNGQLRGMKKLKTDNAKRLITLHRALVDLGFVDWAQGVQKRLPKGGSSLLFQGFSNAQTPANAASKKLVASVKLV